MANSTIAHNSFVTKIYPLIRRLSEDTVQLQQSASEHFSKLGGIPLVPEGFHWPYNGDTPLDFISQIKLSEIHAESLNKLFPDKGLLYFFFSQKSGDSMFHFGHKKEDGSKWRVLYFENEDSVIKEHSSSGDMLDTKVYKQSYLKPITIRTFPHEDYLLKHGIEIHETDSLFYDTFRDFQYKGTNSINQIGGYPSEIHNGFMDLECTLATRGIDRSDKSEENMERIDSILCNERCNDEHILLLQIDSDDYENMNWGDGGRLYFWITRQDLLSRDFSKVWMILQCH